MQMNRFSKVLLIKRVVINIKSMSQKFINLVEKTEKKAPVYEAPKSKRFARKRSQQSDRSIDSKKSRQTHIQPCLKLNDLATVDSKVNRVHMGGGDFFQQLATSGLMSKELQHHRNRYARGRTQRQGLQSRRQYDQQKSTTLEYQALSAELEVRNKELEVIVSECQMIKETVKQQEQRRKRLQQQKKQISNQLSQKMKELQKVQIQNKKLGKEKEYLIKQIQFLEKINYDDKTRNAQSYREKYLTKELQELRKQISMSKSDMERHLETEIKRISDQKYSIETLYRALKVQKETLIKQIEMFRRSQKNKKSLEKVAIYNSEEYAKLRNKYHLCLDSYKELKIKYMEIQKQLNRSLNSIPDSLLNSDSSLSIVLSSSSEGSPSLIKENKKLTRMAKNQIFIQTVNEKTPCKKSLNPKNRDERRQLDVKKPISPVSNKKSLDVSGFVMSSPEPKVISRPLEKKTDKRTTYFNQEYRLKIGLGKTLPSER